MHPEPHDIHAIILAGGQGTRLQSVISDRPKVLAPLGTKTVLDFILDDLLLHGFHNITLSTGYMKEKIRGHMEKRFLPEYAHISFLEEEIPLGTGGAIKKSLENSFSETVLVVNGDTIFPIDYTSFVQQHRDYSADVSVCLHQVDNAGRYGTVHTDINNRVTYFREKDARGVPGIINGGIYLFKRDVLRTFDFPETFSIEKDFFEKHTHDVKVCGFTFPGDFIDIGLPEDYAKAQNIFF